MIHYNTMGAGLLTGKYSPGQRPDKGRLTDNKMYQARYDADWMYAVAGRFTEFARQRGYEPAALAAAWVGSHPAVTAPIIGARSLVQLEGSLKSVDIVMTPELRAEISALSPEPPTATDRNDEVAQK